jgi:hypothetical protein
MVSLQIEIDHHAQGGNKTCGVGNLLSDSDIALVQDSWAIAKDIPTIQTRTLLEYRNYCQYFN